MPSIVAKRVCPETKRLVEVALVTIRSAIFVVPVKLGDTLKTAEPVPTSSESRFASSAEVSTSVESSTTGSRYAGAIAEPCHVPDVIVPMTSRFGSDVIFDIVVVEKKLASESLASSAFCKSV